VIQDWWLKMRVVRIIHLIALSVALLSLAVAASTWLLSHTLGDTSWRERANLSALVLGVILGGVLLWGSVRSATWTMETTVALYLCWISLFGWYWFNRFGAPEVHSFDPQQAEVERVRQLITSGAFFLLWVILCSIGPFFSAARRSRH
jgi:hypothetical protein